MSIDNPFKPPEFPISHPVNPLEVPKKEEDRVLEEKPLSDEPVTPFTPVTPTPSGKPSEEQEARTRRIQPETEVGTPRGFNETALEYVQRTLGEYNNIESDIPTNHAYWRVKQEVNADANR
jgi:hypothetical protein